MSGHVRLNRSKFQTRVYVARSMFGAYSRESEQIQMLECNISSKCHQTTPYNISPIIVETCETQLSIERTNSEASKRDSTVLCHRLVPTCPLLFRLLMSAPRLKHSLAIRLLPF